VSAELFHAEEQTNRQKDRLYMMETKVTFRKFANTPKNTALLFICFLSFPKQAVTISSKHFSKFVFIVGENIFFGRQKLNTYSSDSFRFSKR